MFQAFFPILVALITGAILGRLLPTVICKGLTRLISPMVLLLLFAIGCEFGEVLSTPAVVGHSLLTALVVAAFTSFLPWTLIWLCSGRQGNIVHATAFTTESTPFARTIKECATAVMIVMAGALLSRWQLDAYFLVNGMLSPAALLYALILFVGIDIAGLRLDRSWLSTKVLSIPLLAIVGSLVGGLCAAVVLGIHVMTALALSSGFGWFTLSGVLVGSYLGQAYGSIAFLTDLFRELIAILLLYSLGGRFPQACIGAGGATSLDSTLPIIRQTCHASSLPAALVSGFILTMLAPFLITLWLSRA